MLKGVIPLLQESLSVDLVLPHGSGLPGEVGSLQSTANRHFFQVSVLTLISVSIPPPCYRSSMYKIPVILPKVQVAGYS